jgi:hydroxymethylpyrimidine/phosphomethylpyrimidine kinase
MKPSKGLEFVPSSMLSKYKKLLNISDFIFPNLEELSILSERKITGWSDATQSAIALSLAYDISVLLKGGHTSTNNIKEGLVKGHEQLFFTKARRSWLYTHGTGCALSTAFACNLMKDVTPFESYRKASRWVSKYYQNLNQELV